MQNVCIEFGLDHIGRECEAECVQITDDGGGEDARAFVAAAGAGAVEVAGFEQGHVEAQACFGGEAQQMQSGETARWPAANDDHPAAIFQTHGNSVPACASSAPGTLLN